MDNIIRQLALLDDRAKSILRESEENLANLPALIEEKSKEVIAAIEKNTEREIESIKRGADTEISGVREETNRNLNVRIAGLEELYGKFGDKWVVEITKKVLGGFSQGGD